MRFFKRYNYIMLITFILVSATGLGLFYLQYNIQYQYEMSKIENAFVERALHLATLKTAQDQVDGMKLSAETYFHTNAQVISHSPLFSQLQQVSEQQYNLDTISPPFSEKIVGNLTGKGSLQQRDVDFYREMEMAFSLNPLFQVISYSTPNAIWIYYLSKNKFINLYPWVNSRDFAFDEEFYTHEFYQKSLPELNPTRKTFWTEVYIDSAGKGLMVTCAAPIYEQEHFLGTVALDIALEGLNKFIQDFQPSAENLFIINQKDQLIAHTHLVNSHNKTIYPSILAFPAVFHYEQMEQLFNSPEEKLIEINDYLMIYKQISPLPWKLIFWIPKQQIHTEVFSKISLGFMILLPGLFLLLLFSYLITLQEFIQPAQYLIKHIESENHGIEATIPTVPRSWKVWFLTVSRIFAENRRLFAELRNYSASLEERNQQLFDNNKRLAELNREKNEFLGIVAHDLKNPLSGILGLAEFLLETEGDVSKEELLECATTIQDASKNMFQLITNLLDVNAIESGKINMELQPTDIYPILKRIIKNNAVWAERKQIQINLQAVTMHYVALVDEQITLQILDNLISNALKYSPLGKNIYIRLYAQTHSLRCEIIDEGQGISPNDQKKLFSKFTRLTPKPTADEHSNGLGLFIVKKLVDAMHATIECQSELGTGTTFIVEFPKI